ncbi:hypothetical protein BDV95DRAFT_488734 [Massariosphaeria phaeospora]|uniref:tRNA wybutosine-synthesizing protein 4 n=1 Tax=Massariosphaeria phaeospora TaxID=100035 RepID=A0A7C8MB76_9PLEO|nr:hypothetical protein BDV95DRAFT_488734 [Massariosphaeria phaeospora]
MAKSRQGTAQVGSSKHKLARSAQERTDDSIMNTNDSSIVSKRSVSKLYFPDEPNLYQPFVQKFTRRTPLINRGYWLRMHAIEQIVRRFLEEDDGKPKVVVNLGCGYDPLPFQFWHRHTTISKEAVFVDVDYPQLIGRKRDRMLADSLLRDALLGTNLRGSELPVYLRSDRYMAIGCDLRDLDTLERTLRSAFDVSASSFLFLAEVSLTYMPLPDSDSLIRWASTLDDGPDHPFAQTMLRHFDKLQTPIQAVKQYPSLNQHSSRFLDAGWPTLSLARNLWDLWSDDAFTSPSIRRSLDAIEPFDEWEEFALFSGHYFLLVASNSVPVKTAETATLEKSSTIPGSVDGGSAQPIVLTSHISAGGTQPTPRRFGAAASLAHDLVGFHGGQGAQHRLASLDMLGREAAVPTIQPCRSPQARMCHTITSTNMSEVLLVGGRASPLQALADCWLMRGGAWQQVQDLTPARFRHSSAGLNIPSEGSLTGSVLVFGGKTSEGLVLAEWALWTYNKGWMKVPVDGSHQPSARFGAAISCMDAGQKTGLLVGGMGPDGTVLDDIWHWTFSATPTPRLKFTDRTNDIVSSATGSTHARVGASLVPFGNSLLLIGGAAQKRILGLHNEFLIVSAGALVHLQNPVIAIPKSVWPLLVGFGAAAVSQDEIVLAGGGAVCFSMGSFWNEGYLTISKPDSPDIRPWSVAVYQAEKTEQEQPPKSQPGSKGKTQAKMSNARQRNTAMIPRVQLKSANDFTELIAASKPAIIEGLDIGPCTELWTLDYLKEKIGAEREIVIHECDSDRMTFKDKNFQYIKQPFGDFLDGISRGAKTYLRAVSSTQPNKLPTKLTDDFPTIAPDFQLPSPLTPLQETHHSSPLRISGPVSLWLHYDVLANILCQVRGSKTLHLYPPSDVQHLGFPPGGSSSNVDVLAGKDPNLRHTHPHVAVLGPGDVLFIPPMWAHTATPSEGSSVAVNVFFRNLKMGYAAGKDVYGNRDLQAYDNGRRDVEKIGRAFKDVPDDIAKFYLERLAAELLEKAGKR